MARKRVRNLGPVGPATYSVGALLVLLVALIGSGCAPLVVGAGYGPSPLDQARTAYHGCQSQGASCNTEAEHLHQLAQSQGVEDEARPAPQPVHCTSTPWGSQVRTVCQ